jgi:hypothetical protein
MVMKQNQWVVAVIVLAAMVGLITYAMTYLGMGIGPGSNTTTIREDRELTFLWKEAPLGGHSGIEVEEKTEGHQDYWFFNANSEPVTVGLKTKNCKCTAVELFVLPQEAESLLARDARRMVELGGSVPALPLAGGLSLLAYHEAALPRVQEMAGRPHELKHATESADVPGKAIGWVRLRWHADNEGRQTMAAALWFHSSNGDKGVNLMAAVRIYQPLRVRPTLSMGHLREDALGAKTTRDVICWSSTRTSLRLEAKDGKTPDPYHDPFFVGKPEPLGVGEIRELEKRNRKDNDITWEGRVLCAYRIPVTALAVSKDGKTPFDIGPFRRHVIVSCPDVPEPKQVTVTGRVSGIVEIGSDDSGAEIDFTAFPRLQGKRESIAVQSDRADVELSVDDKRTSKFLKATLQKPDPDRQEWKLLVEVKPGEAFGDFPRRDDPLFEDSAVYLTATYHVTDKKGEKKKTTRPIRIAVKGTANER